MRDLDAEEMRAVQAGELARFARIVERHQSRLFRYASSRLGCRSLAEDAVQETFLAVYRSRASFDPSRSFRAWLWTIHVHECQRAHRESERNRRDQQAARELAISESAPVTVDSLERAEAQALLARSLDRLPPEQAESLRLRYFGELEFEEIAAATDTNAATAKSRVRYGLAKLSGMLGSKQETLP